jgi:putative Holliday junction resolvase
MRCLGIDYGEKRIGLAYGDELGVATPLAAAVAGEFAERMQRIRNLIKERGVTDLVVGFPYNMDGSTGFKAREVESFIAQLEAAFCLPVHRVDERLSSRAAQDALGLRGHRERELRKSGIIDSAAAALILQDWLNQRVPSVEAFPSAEDEED